MKKILFIFGTRPEAIKLAPVIKMMDHYDSFKSVICVTAQHREMLDQVLDIFSIRPDFDLDIMQQDQTLFDITAMVLLKMKKVLEESEPDMVIVQGDTTTTFSAALAAYYRKIPIAHVEAGLRSFSKYSPFPEEMNRAFASRMADLHFAPTQWAVDNLLKENIPDDRIYLTGNTVIDSLLFIDQQIEISEGTGKKKQILITGHRRENFGVGFKNICQAINEIAIKYPDVQLIYPVHLNPHVQKPVKEILSGINNVQLIEPVNYLEFVKLMKNSYLILTDSGGVQEEAPTFGIPVLVMREVTERPEGVDAGVAKLVGTDKSKIVQEVSELLDNPLKYEQMSKMANPYGDGQAADRIVQIIEEYFLKSS